MRTLSLAAMALCGAFLLVNGAAAADGSASLTISGTVVSAGGPVAEFAATPTSGLAPLTVQFNDWSTGDPTSWYWTFGDGSSSAQRNPKHTYKHAGAYTVSLTVENDDGSSTEVKQAYIRVSYRLNCGAPKSAYTDTGGNLWPKDQRYYGGSWGWATVSSTGRTKQPIENTADDPLYQEWRYNSFSGALLYRFTVRNGDFQVTTKHLEPYYNDDRRVFDIVMENTVMTPAYRPYIASGGRYRADDEVHIVTVTDGILDLQLRPLPGYNWPVGRNSPLIAAVEVQPVVP
jgi:PKD repeat protein